MSLTVKHGKILLNQTYNKNSRQSRQSKNGGYILVRDDEYNSLEEQELKFTCQPCRFTYTGNFVKGLKKMKDHHKTKKHINNMKKKR